MGSAEDAKRDGMNRAEGAANPIWMQAAAEAVLAVARERETFTSDHVMGAIPPGVTTHEKRALGPVMRNAARDGVMEKAGREPTNSTRRSRHAAPLIVWRSLIHR